MLYSFRDFIICVCLQHLEQWPKHLPLVCHAEARTTAAILLLAELADRPVHIAHVARKEEVRKQMRKENSLAPATEKDCSGNMSRLYVCASTKRLLLVVRTWKVIENYVNGENRQKSILLGNKKGR